MNLLSPGGRKRLQPAETHSYPAPLPTQSVSSDEFMPARQSSAQRRVEARIKELGNELARKQGMTRRRFFQTASGMAAAFLVMNEVYGHLYDVSRAEAQTPDMAKERAAALSKQFIMDCHTHFLRDDTRILTFVRQRGAAGHGRVEPPALRQAADGRRPEVPELFQGGVPRQRHEGGADLGLPVGHPARLVPEQRDEGRGARASQHGSGLAADAEPR